MPDKQLTKIQKQNVSIIMPVYNLGESVCNIKHIVTRLDRELGGSFELLVVDDGSTDDTLAFARKIRDERVKITGYSKNLGKGGAVTYGFSRSTGDLVVFADGDLQAFPRDIRSYLEALECYDIAIASKRVVGSQLEACSKRKILSIGFNLLSRILLGISLSDTQVGFKAFRRSSLERILPLASVKRYAFDVEILAIATLLEFKIVELPAHVILIPKFPKKNILRMLIDLFGIAYRMKLKRWYQKNAMQYRGPYKPLLKW